MEERIEGYSVILIPFPPNPKVQEEIKDLVNKHLNNPPEILRTEIFEGLCFRWRTWYGFDDWIKEMSLRRFKSGLERIYERSEEEMLIIDWRGEDDWNTSTWKIENDMLRSFLIVMKMKLHASPYILISFD